MLRKGPFCRTVDILLKLITTLLKLCENPLLY